MQERRNKIPEVIEKHRANNYIFVLFCSITYVKEVAGKKMEFRTGVDLGTFFGVLNKNI